MKTVLYIVGGLALILAIACAGCGSVELAMDADGGAGATAGSTGAAGSTADGGVVEMQKLDGAAGAAGRAGVGLDGGAAGAGGIGGAAGAMAGAGGAGGAPPPSCVPDACNTCVDGHLKSLADGVRCNTMSTPDTCDGVPPFMGQSSCVSAAHVCSAGACIVKMIDCCATGGPCPAGQKHRCSGSAEDPAQPTFCVTSCE